MVDANGDYIVTARPWPDIIRHYERVQGSEPSRFAPMAGLVRHIAESRLASGVFGITSLYTLILGQTPTFPMHREVLRIDFDPTEQVFKFEFDEGSASGKQRPKLASPRPPPSSHNWKKTCPADQGVAALEHFLYDQKKWFMR